MYTNCCAVETAPSADGAGDEVDQMQVIRCHHAGPRIIVRQLAFFALASPRLDQTATFQDAIDGSPAGWRDACALQLGGQRIRANVGVAQLRLFTRHDDLPQADNRGLDILWYAVVNPPGRGIGS